MTTRYVPIPCEWCGVPMWRPEHEKNRPRFHSNCVVLRSTGVTRSTAYPPSVSVPKPKASPPLISEGDVEAYWESHPSLTFEQAERALRRATS